MNNVESKVLIFGGAFNPPTLAHQEIMAGCLALAGFDEVWVMPSGDRADKTIPTEDNDRLAMLNLVKKHAFNDTPRLKITDFELKLPHPSETHRTIGALALAYPKTELWFVYGADSYWNMGSWDHGEELRDNLNMVIIPRAGYPEPNREGIITLDIGEFNAYSSSAARAGGMALARMVSPPIQDYLLGNRLYAPDTV